MKTLATLAREVLGAVALTLWAKRSSYVVSEDPDELGYFVTRRTYADEV